MGTHRNMLKDSKRAQRKGSHWKEIHSLKVLCFIQWEVAGNGQMAEGGRLKVL